MTISRISPSVFKVSESKDNLATSSLVIVAAGFEERALHFFNNIWCKAISNLLVVRYSSPPEENQQAFSKVEKVIKESKKNNQKVTFADLDPNGPSGFEKEFERAIQEQSLPNYGSIWLDISGLPTFGICIVLNICRNLFPLMELNIVYTEAREYFPTKQEYERYFKKFGKKGVERLPKSLTSEMSENLILDTFSGFSIRKDPTCLILYAGYEKHRSLGAIENINPNKIVIIYGKPARPDLEWRLEMSKHLHSNLINERICAQEELSTLDIEANINLLREYYEMLYDQHNICISPINSKLQTIATYLVWELFKDIQLVFPMPIRYLPKRFSKEIGRTYTFMLPFPESVDVLGRRGLHHHPAIS